MTLRSKLLLAQAPLISALLVIAVAASALLSDLGRTASKILQNNYRSVLAAQRMLESAERMDSAALFALTGRRAQGQELARVHRERFEQELRTQEGNITEVGEREATERLRAAWHDYLAAHERFLAGEPQTSAAYFDTLLPAFQTLTAAARDVLTLNQDAMLRKSESASGVAEHSVTLLLIVVAAGLSFGLYASAALTSRLLRPLSVLAQATRRIGEGDLVVRAIVTGRDEVSQLAEDFNFMAERLQTYRASTLGELLQVQRAAQAAIDSLPDPVLVLSLGGSLLQTNRAGESLLGASVESGLAVLDPVVRDVVDRVRQHAAEGKGAYVPRGLEEAIRLTTPQGERCYLPRATPVYADEGNVVGTALVLQDVTRLLRFEELRNDVVATVAHELRTPLTSLRMAVHLLIEQRVGPLTEKQADLVYAAREDCDRLQAVGDELLDLSWIQAGKLELRLESCEVESLVRTALDAQQGLAAERQVELRSELLPGLRPVLADAERIPLVFANLLQNALRHSPGGSTVVIRALESGDQVRFEISDTGVGIPAEHHEAIFEKYFRLPGAPRGGIGLGLYIAREIVQAHGGAIGVASAPPALGSTFWFTLRGAERRAYDVR